jgi:hypothetical protein
MLLWSLPLTRRRSAVRSRQHPPIKSIAYTLLSSPRQPQHSHCGTFAGLLHAVGCIEQVSRFRSSVSLGVSSIAAARAAVRSTALRHPLLSSSSLSTQATALFLRQQCLPQKPPFRRIHLLDPSRCRSTTTNRLFLLMVPPTSSEVV